MMGGVAESRWNPAFWIAKRNIRRLKEKKISALIVGRGEPERYINTISHKTLLGIYLKDKVELDVNNSKYEAEIMEKYIKTKERPKILLVIDMDGVLDYPIADLFSGKDFNKLGIPNESEIKVLLKLAEAGMPVYIWTNRWKIEDNIGWWSDLKEKVASWFTRGRKSAFPFIDPVYEQELNWESGGNLKLWSSKSRKGRGLETVLEEQKEIDYLYYVGSSPTDDAIVERFLEKNPKEKKRMTYIRIPQLFL